MTVDASSALPDQPKAVPALYSSNAGGRIVPPSSRITMCITVYGTATTNRDTAETESANAQRAGRPIRIHRQPNAERMIVAAGPANPIMPVIAEPLVATSPGFVQL